MKQETKSQEPAKQAAQQPPKPEAKPAQPAPVATPAPAKPEPKKDQKQETHSFAQQNDKNSKSKNQTAEIK